MWTVCCKMVFNSHSHYVNSSGTESESGVDGFAGVRSILLSHEVHEGFILVCIMRLSQYRCITSIVNSCCFMNSFCLLCNGMFVFVLLSCFLLTGLTNHSFLKNKWNVIITACTCKKKKVHSVFFFSSNPISSTLCIFFHVFKLCIFDICQDWRREPDPKSKQVAITLHTLSVCQHEIFSGVWKDSGWACPALFFLPCVFFFSFFSTLNFLAGLFTPPGGRSLKHSNWGHGAFGILHRALWHHALRHRGRSEQKMH